MTELDMIRIFLSRIAENSDQVYWLTDPEFQRLIYINPAYEKIWGRSRDVLYDSPKDWTQYLFPRKTENHYPALAKRLIEEGPNAYYDEEYHIISSVGDTHFIAAHGFPLYNEKQECYAIVGIARDITREKFKEFTAENSKEAEEIVNQSRSEFLTSMRHKLEAPLNDISTATQSLREHISDETLQEHINTLEKSNRHLSELVNDTMEIVKVELGELRIEQRLFNLRRLIAEVIDDLRPHAIKKNSHLTIDYPYDIHENLIGDPIHVKQVIVSLINNAIKFTCNGHIHVAVDMLDQAYDEVTLQISIVDTGCGSDKEGLNTIFDRFYQGDPNHLCYRKEIGLDFTVSKHLTELLGGEITVNVYKKRCSANVLCILPFFIQVESLEDINVQQEKIRAIVVGNDPLNARIISNHAQGIETTTVEEKAVVDVLLKAQRKEEPYQVVIIEKDLKDIDACELSKRIRAESTFNKIMLVLLTDEHTKELKDKYRDAGFYCYINEPRETTIEILPRAWKDWNQAIIQNAKKPFNANIFLVEDNKINQRVEKAMLESFGCHVDVASSGEEALEILNDSYDLIFVDIGLGSMNGLELTKAIRKRGGKYAKIPVLALTACVLKNERKDYFANGFDEIIIKPVVLDQLQIILGFWLDKANLCHRRSQASFVRIED